jgi:hypothetical protein
MKAIQTFFSNHDLEVRVVKVKVVRDNPSSDSACVYEEIVKLSRAYQKLWTGKQKVTIF